MSTEDTLKEFMERCDKNIIVHDQHKRLDLETFDKLTMRAYAKLKHLTNENSDYTSFACGIGAGMRMTTLPKNEE